LVVEVDDTVTGRQEPRQFRVVAIKLSVILGFTDPKVAVGAAEHVLLLSDSAFHICTTGHIGIGHVENGETYPVMGSQQMCDLTPVSGKDFDAELRVRRTPRPPPTLKILPGKTMVMIRRIGFVENSNCLAQDLASARAFGATKSPTDGFFVGAQAPSS
jgi:hypothetical protein